MKYTNENPTKTERILFEQYVYPSSVEVENDMVEWEHDILFDIFTEIVTIHGNYDSTGITLIHERMKELNFN